MGIWQKSIVPMDHFRGDTEYTTAWQKLATTRCFSVSLKFATTKVIDVSKPEWNPIFARHYFMR